MLKVKVFKYDVTGSGSSSMRKTVRRAENGFAGFHAWTTQFEELRDGVGQSPAAIVERETGEIEIIPAENIEFVRDGIYHVRFGDDKPIFVN